MSARERGTRYTEHQDELVHTFGVSDYDVYWKALPADLAKRTILKRVFTEVLRLAAPPARILELGPGPGRIFSGLSEAGYEMHGWDASSVSLEQLEASPGRLHQVDFNAGLPEGDEKFEVIIGAMVLHHIVDPEAFLLALKARLEDGGHLVLTVPNITVIRNRLRLLIGQFPKFSPSHRNFMTPWEVGELLRRCGYHPRGILAPHRRPLQQLRPTLFSKEILIIAQA
jgi:2-polyprenyl-3-methyl-5-hydroxy-6-metoxy-1,4-benzoquinol methylase